MIRSWLGLLLVLIGATLPPAHAAQRTVSIVDFAYQPASITAQPGEQIVWTNDDAFTHTVTFDAPGMGSGPLAPGATYATTIMVPGRWTYFCALHPSMRGAVDIVAAPPDFPPRAYLPLVVDTTP